jgi:hypothetical protein
MRCETVAGFRQLLVHRGEHRVHLRAHGIIRWQLLRDGMKAPDEALGVLQKRVTEVVDGLQIAVSGGHI